MVSRADRMKRGLRSGQVLCPEGPEAPAEQDTSALTPERYLLASEVKAIFRVGARTLWDWDAAGILKSISPTRRRLYRQSDVEQLIRNRGR